jgi:demethylmenaquinone methyltransferase / 2-methoxy-6-polyprenyl-1,4-benzoquinol methylase
MMVHRAQRLSAPEPRKQQALDLFAALPKRYDEMGWVLSFGQDRRWRRETVRAIQATESDRVLDVATGTGLIAAELVRRYGCSVVGIDQSEDMLARAHRRLAREPQLSRRVRLMQGEAERLPFADGEFDGLTTGYLFRYVDDPAATIRELARVVRSGGRIASMEFGVPPFAPARRAWNLYTRFGLPGVGRLVSRGWYEIGRFLSHSIPQYYERYPLAVQRRFWEDAGIRSVEVRRMSFGAGIVISGTRDADGSVPG